MTDIAGFWSYAHADNANDDDRIIKLAKRLSNEFELLGAEPLELFIDRQDLRWGEEWKRRIDEALQQTTFFIPIITPGYFRSEECRRELLIFKAAAEAFGVKQLVLPLYYVDVQELDAEKASEDELMTLMRDTQREDIRNIRLCDESGSQYRTIVNKLASRLIEIARLTEEQTDGVAGGATDPSSGATLGPVGAVSFPGTVGDLERSKKKSNGDELDEGSEAGYLEILAAGEAALPEWHSTIQALSDEMKVITELTEQSVAEMQAENETGTATFASRLAAANRLARRLDEPAETITKLGQDYAANLIAVDPAIQTLIRLAREDEDVRDTAETRKLFDTIREMVQASRQTMSQVSEFTRAIMENASASRELRRPLKRIDNALRNITDAQSVQDAWESQIEAMFDD